MVQDAGARILMVAPPHAGLFSDIDAHVIVLDGDRVGSTAAASSAADLSALPGPDDPAYVIYTSGSTGQPKGIIVPHRQVLNRLHWMWETYPFAAGEVCCQKTPLSFVDSLWEMLGGLLKGVSTVIVPEQTVLDVPALVKCLADHRVTRIWVVPSFLRLILDTVSNLRERLPDLTFWVCTGERLPVDLHDRFRWAMPRARLHNVYGTSEIWDATWFDPELHSVRGNTVPIGRPMANVRTYVLDRQLQPVPVGVVGQLHVDGYGLGRGYLNRAGLTSQAFLPNPFGPRGTTVYATGDLVRYLPDGNLEFVGRRDRQLKIRGFRVEAEEVEACLNRHDAVRDAAVVGQTSAAGEEQLVAYVVPRDNAPAPEDLRRYLSERLPAPMVPAVFVALPSLPLTPSGKVDRRSLCALDVLENGQPHVPPATPLEEVLAEVWSDVLGGTAVGVTDDFFARLGGHSLLVTQIMSRVRDLFQVELPLQRFFDGPTVRAIASALLEERDAAARVSRTAELLLTVADLPDAEVGAMLLARAGQASQASGQ
jgi:amino acid adenylation domain-containing protein